MPIDIITMLLKPDLMDDLLERIDHVSRQENAFEYGLPLHDEANKAMLRETVMRWAAEHGGKPVKCDGNHGGPRCGDPECWNDSPAQPAPVASVAPMTAEEVYALAGEMVANAGYQGGATSTAYYKGCLAGIRAAERHRIAQQPAPVASVAEMVTEALNAYEAAFENLFGQCGSNPITNAWGVQVSMTHLNAAHELAQSALKGRCVRVGPCECAPEAMQGCVSWQQPAPAVPAGWREAWETARQACKAGISEHRGFEIDAMVESTIISRVLSAFEALHVALSAAPKPEADPAIWSLWEALPGHLIDNYEGQALTEELLQQAASELFAAKAKQEGAAP